MNTSIEKIIEKTEDGKVREIAAKLMAWNGKKIHIKFLKKSGEIRDIIFSVVSNWNFLNGIKTTEWGKKMTNTKISRNMICVTEILGNGIFQPRTVDLTKVIEMNLV